jgi:hypothetical protein
MWHKDFALTIETDEYLNPLNRDERGLVEIHATASFREDGPDEIKINKVYCTDTDKLVTLSSADTRMAMFYLEARAYDRIMQWQAEAELADYCRTEDWKVMDLLGK